MVTTRSKTGSLPGAPHKLINEVLMAFKPKKSTKAPRKRATSTTGTTKATKAKPRTIPWKTTRKTIAKKPHGSKRKTQASTTRKPASNTKKPVSKKALTAAEKRAEAAKMEKEALAKEKQAAAAKKAATTARRDATAARRAAAAKDNQTPEKKDKGPATETGRVSKSRTPSRSKSKSEERSKTPPSPQYSTASESNSNRAPSSKSPSPEEVSEQASRSISDHAVRYCLQLNLRRDIINVARTLSGRWSTTGPLPRREQRQVAAAIVHFASCLLKQPRSVEQINEVADVGKGTIREHYRALYDQRNALVDDDWIRDGKGTLALLPKEYGITDSDDSS
ncbi:MAG: transcription initiation factor IIB [Candelina submexicana]|nr:MAG: transcription initiation factor IIB [Candelina submexicana]